MTQHYLKLGQRLPVSRAQFLKNLLSYLGCTGHVSCPELNLNLHFTSEQEFFFSSPLKLYSQSQVPSGQSPSLQPYSLPYPPPLTPCEPTYTFQFGNVTVLILAPEAPNLGAWDALAS